MILLKNAVLLDANHNNEPLDVLVDGDTIVSVGKDLPCGGEVIDLTGCTLMPGLFDAHVHLCPSRVPDEWILDPQYYIKWAQAGILGIRDMGLHKRTTEQFLQFRDEISAPEYPRITTYGPFIYAPGDMKGPFPTDTTVEQAEESAGNTIEHGLPGVKLMLNMKSNDDTAAVVTAVAKAADQAHVKSAAHIYVSADIELLLDCGIHEAAHSPMDRLPDSTIARMKAADMTIVPTVANYYRMHRDGMLTKEQFDTTIENIGRCAKAGIRIGFGTDFMLTEDRPYIGYMVPTEEMRLMAKSGMSVQEVITSATKNSAWLCGFDDMGVIAPGMKAALVAVKGTVDETFTQLDSMELVMNQGKVIHRA